MSYLTFLEVYINQGSIGIVVRGMLDMKLGKDRTGWRKCSGHGSGHKVLVGRVG